MESEERLGVKRRAEIVRLNGGGARGHALSLSAVSLFFLSLAVSRFLPSLSLDLLRGAGIKVAATSYKEGIACEDALGPVGIFCHKCHVSRRVAGRVENACDEKVE